MSDPKILSIKKVPGIAGQYGYAVRMQYEGEQPEVTQFVGSVYGGPIVMMFGGHQVFVSQRVTDRIGSKLDPDWVRAFFAPSASAGV